MDIRIIASGSKGNAYYINDGVSSLLLDAGIPIKAMQPKIDFKLSELSGALITHKHNDHSKAVPDLVRYGVDVYAPAEVFEAKAITSHRAHNLEPLKGVKIGEFSVMPFELQHDCVNYGFLIESTATGERLLYFTDTFYVKYRFERLDYILAECNYSEDVLNANIESGAVPAVTKPRLLKSHMSINTLVDMLKSNNLSRLKQIYLLHISERNGDEAEFIKKIRDITEAEVYAC